GASDKRLKLNPRKAWYENVKDIETKGDYEVTFVLNRPQPGLLSLLASGYSPVYPAHVDPQEIRTKEVGTGPFIIKEVKPDQELVMVKNPHYFIKGKPYLDEIDFIVIKSRPSRFAALESGQLDISFPGENTVPMRDEVRSKAPKIKIYEVAQSVHDNILLNFTKPPFNDARLRRAVNLALDRKSMIQSVLQGGAVEGAANIPPPYGKWGIPAADLVKFPGYGDPEQNKAEARKLLAEAGYGPDHPLEITVETRAIDIYIDTAVWVIDRLKQVGIVGHLEQFETGVWHPKLTRKEFTLATNLTGVGSDDPDANFYENYACGSSRNYSGYCNQEVMDLINKQSAETNAKKRLALVREIDGRLQEDGARPILAHRIDYMMMWPYVKGIVPHQSIYSYGRMTDAWLDK
ncbi:MAG TPA: ABC transporter substrate-binding protein, partial [bacterium]|nr:ABC transporter substrate-binding protein [bacterium]